MLKRIPSACCLLTSPVKKQMSSTHLTSKYNGIVRNHGISFPT